MCYKTGCFSGSFSNFYLHVYVCMSVCTPANIQAPIQTPRSGRDETRALQNGPIWHISVHLLCIRPVYLPWSRATYRHPGHGYPRGDSCPSSRPHEGQPWSPGRGSTGGSSLPVDRCICMLQGVPPGGIRYAYPVSVIACMPMGMHASMWGVPGHLERPAASAARAVLRPRLNQFQLVARNRNGVGCDILRPPHFFPPGPASPDPVPKNRGAQISARALLPL